jgi:trans-aconitate methyltransferase
VDTSQPYPHAVIEVRHSCGARSLLSTDLLCDLALGELTGSNWAKSTGGHTKPSSRSQHGKHDRIAMYQQYLLDIEDALQDPNLTHGQRIRRFMSRRAPVGLRCPDVPRDGTLPARPGLGSRFGRSSGLRTATSLGNAEDTDMNDTNALLADQVAYYRAVAAEYQLSEPAHDFATALDEFRPAGDVLELACGPGTWTQQLLGHAATVTAVDAAPEMLARAQARVGEGRVRFVQADLFEWTPELKYDFVFFGFWLSHVPPERFSTFWTLVRTCLNPNGRVFFVDDNARMPEELVYGEASFAIQRRLRDGTAHRAVKVPYQPAELEERLRRLGWLIDVTPVWGPYYYGAGAAAPLIGRSHQ